MLCFVIVMCLTSKSGKINNIIASKLLLEIIWHLISLTWSMGPSKQSWNHRSIFKPSFGTWIELNSIKVFLSYLCNKLCLEKSILSISALIHNVFDKINTNSQQCEQIRLVKTISRDIILYQCFQKSSSINFKCKVKCEEKI